LFIYNYLFIFFYYTDKNEETKNHKLLLQNVSGRISKHTF